MLVQPPHFDNLVVAAGQALDLVAFSILVAVVSSFFVTLGVVKCFFLWQPFFLKRSLLKLEWTCGVVDLVSLEIEIENDKKRVVILS